MMKFFALAMAMAAALTVGAAEAPKLEVISAKWGAGSQTLDMLQVTAARVRNGNMLYLDAGDMRRFGDPAPGVGKELVVVYKENGQEKTVKVGEYDKPVILVSGDFPVSKDLTVLAATYGSGALTRDLTEFIKIQVKENKEVAIGNVTVGDDPAPNVAKETLVLYSLNGELKVLVVPENGVFKTADLK